MSNIQEQCRLLNTAADKFLAENNSLDALSSDILTNVVLETIKTYQIKLNVGIQDSISDLIQQFRQRVSEAIFETASGWRLANKDPFLFPKNCRFCYQKGKTTLLVIEQDPQIRSLLFSKNMLELKEPLNWLSESERIALSIPYVVFVVSFTNNLFNGLYCGWRDRQLTSLDDMLFRPILPNIHDSLAVCTGTMEQLSGSISQMTDTVISQFWNSRFNGDVSQFWWKKQTLDERIESARIWSENSLQDSTFILNLKENVCAKTVQQLLDLITKYETEPDACTFKHKLSEAIESSTELLFNRILRYFKKTQFDKYHPKEIKTSLCDIMKEANKELADLALAIKNEVGILSNRISESDGSKIKPVGPYWESFD